jgi:hypothetical protein
MPSLTLRPFAAATSSCGVRVIPELSVSFTELNLALIIRRILQLQDKQLIDTIHCTSHDRPHFLIADPRVSRASGTRWTGLPGVNILYWSISERESYNRLCLSCELSAGRIGRHVDIFSHTRACSSLHARRALLASSWLSSHRVLAVLHFLSGPLSRAPAALEPTRPALACVLLCRFPLQVSQY